MNNTSRKRTRTALLPMLAAIAVGSLWLWLSPMAAAQSELYNRYANRAGVRVAEVEGFRIDSATAIDVLVVEAVSDAGWQWMKGEFAIGDPAPEQQRDLLTGNDVVLFAQRDSQWPGKPAPMNGEQVDASASCYLGISYLSRTVYIFAPKTAGQAEAIVSRLVLKMLNRSNP
ncbi:MAG: hypothetical protein K5650_05150 [Bacteroidales bacterium]|nr:hypothetical protein [Bacteroidales bacterium]